MFGKQKAIGLAALAFAMAASSVQGGDRPRQSADPVMGAVRQVEARPGWEAWPGFSGSTLVAAGGDYVWIFDPVRRTLERRPLEPWPNLRVERVESADRVRIVDRRVDDLPPAAGPWKIPQRLWTLLRASDGLRLIAESDQAAWILSPATRLALRWEGGLWSAPLSLSRNVHAAASLDRGKLLIWAEDGGGSALEVLDSAGPARSFLPAGDAPPPTSPGALARLADGSLLLVQSQPLLARAYSASGRLLWSRNLEAPVERPGQQPLWAQGDRESGFWLRWGEEPWAGRYGPTGELQGKTHLLLADGEPIRSTAGLAATDHRWIIADGRGLVAYLSPPAVAHQGRVVDEAGRPVAGAQVRVEAETGEAWFVEADPNGEFEISVLPPGTRGSVHAFASEAVPSYREGRLTEILAEPLLLKPSPRPCLSVIDAESGAPVARYAVQVFPAEPVEQLRLARGPSLSRHVLLPEDGLACFGAAWPLPWIVLVEAEGFAATQVQVSREETLEVALHRPIGLTVEVRQESGEPISGASVELERSTASDPDLRVTSSTGKKRSDDEGKAAFEGLEPALYALQVSHPDYLDTDQEIDLTESRTVAVELAPGRALRVIAQTAAAEPIGGAAVTAEILGDETEGEPATCVTAAEDGSCEILGLSGGRLKVRVATEGYATGFSTLYFEEGAASAEVEITLVPSLRLTGRLLGVETYPGQRFAVSISAPGIRWQHATVDSEGGFAFESAPTGLVRILVSGLPGWAEILLRKVEVPTGIEDYSLELELPAALALHGEVRIDGRVCGGCRLRFAPMGSLYNSGQSFQAHAAADGFYEIRLPGPGTYLLEVRDPRSKGVLTDSLSVAASGSRDLLLGTGTVTGIVLDAADQAVSGARVQATAALTHQSLGTTSSGGEGGFSLGPLTAQRVVLSAEHEGRAVSLEVDLGDAVSPRVELRLPDSEALKVRLIDAQSGRPILVAGDFLLISARGELLRLRGQQPREGFYSLPAFAAQPLTLVVRVPGFAVATLRGVGGSGQPLEVPLDGDYRGFTYEVLPDLGAPCTLEVRDAAGLPVALSTEFPPGPIPMSGGSGWVGDLAAGSYRVLVQACDGRVGGVDVRLEKGSTPHLVLSGVSSVARP